MSSRRSSQKSQSDLMMNTTTNGTGTPTQNGTTTGKSKEANNDEEAGEKANLLETAELTKGR